MVECSVETLISGMVNTYKNSPRLVRWANQTSPIIDVTDIVKQVNPDVMGAHLTIYGDPSKVRVIYKSPSKPPDHTVDQIVQNWMNGVELERQYCQSDGLWYLVQYPAKLTVDSKSNMIGMLKLLGAYALILLALDYAGTRGRR